MGLHPLLTPGVCCSDHYLTGFTSKKYSSECRLEASNYPLAVSLLCSDAPNVDILRQRSCPYSPQEFRCFILSYRSLRIILDRRSDATAEMETKLIQIILVFCQVSSQNFMSGML